MTTIIQKIQYLIVEKYTAFVTVLLLLWHGRAFSADKVDNPFPKIAVKSGDVVSAVGAHMETSMKYAMIGGGIIMLLAGIGVIMHRLREDSANKETGNFLTTLVIAGLAITVGIILIAIGWDAANYKLQS